MKNIKKITFVTIVFIILLSCTNEKENIEMIELINTEQTEQVNIDPLDDPAYYDTDPDCPINNIGNCCDTDGRILVRPNYSYTYTYKGVHNSNPTTTNIYWKVTSGSIILTSGQGTNTATFKFKSDFTTGTIQAGGWIDNNNCEDTIFISKL